MSEIADVIVSLLKPLIRAFFLTALGMFVLNLITTIFVYRFVAAGGSSGRAAVAALLVLVLGAVLGSMLSVKRALLTAVREGAKAHRLGQRTLGAFFSRLLGVKDGERPQGVLGAAAEKIPLGRAEQLAKDAAAKLIAEGRQSGFFRARLHRMIVERVESLTLSRFRAEEGAAGGIDLVKVRDELSSTVENKLLGMLDGMMLKLTLLIGLGFLGGAFVIAQILTRI